MICYVIVVGNIRGKLDEQPRKLSVDDRRHAVISPQLRACFGTSAFNYLHVTARIRV